MNRDDARGRTRSFARNRKSSLRRRRFEGGVEALEGRVVLDATLAPIPNVTVPATLGYQVPLDGSASGATSQTFTVTSSNPDIKATVATGEFVTFNITHTSSGAGDPAINGAVTFQLFGDLTPNTAQEIQTFVQDGFYNNKDLFRIAPGFPGANDYIIQGGSPTNSPASTPSGEPGTPFPDEFNPQLAFTGNYQIAMANAGPDTNDTQFFFTVSNSTPAAGPQFLNFHHDIFGQVVAGQNILQQITQVALQSGTTPVNPVTITSATLSDTSPDGVIHIDATGAAPGESATISVTANDPSTSTTAQQQFTVNVVADGNAPERPYVQTVPPISGDVVAGLNQTIGAGQTDLFRIPGVAVTPGDPLSYVVAQSYNGLTDTFTPLPASVGTATVDQNGVVTFTPAAGATGPQNLLIGVRDNAVHGSATSVNDPQNYQWHTITVTINPSSTPVPLAPIALPVSQATSQGTAVTVHLQGQNTDSGSTLTYALTAQPSHGTVSQFDASNGTFVYTPTAGFRGTDTFQYTVTASGGGLTSDEASLPATGTLTVNSSFTITSTSPSNGSVVSFLKPNGQITINFSHPIAGLTDGGPALSASDPFAIMLLERGPDLKFSAPSGIDSGDLPLHMNTVYHLNGDGTSSITITPVQYETLAPDVYLVSVDRNAFTDTSGNPLYDANNGYFTFLLQPPAAVSPPQVMGVRAYNGDSTVNNNLIDQPDTLQIRFNKPLFEGAAGGGNVQLLAAPSYTPVPSVAVYNPTTQSIYLTPTATLQPGTTYVIAVSGKVSDDEGYGGPGYPMGQPFYDSFQVINAPAGAGTSPLKVVQDSNGNPKTLPKDGTLSTASLGYASASFTEPLNLSASVFGRYSAMLDLRTVGSDGNTALENVPLNAQLAFNPNTNQLIIVPTQDAPEGLYAMALGSMQATNGDPLENSSGQQAGVSAPPIYATFQIADLVTPLGISRAAPTPAAAPKPAAVPALAVQPSPPRRPAQASVGTRTRPGV